MILRPRLRISKSTCREAFIFDANGGSKSRSHNNFSSFEGWGTWSLLRGTNICIDLTLKINIRTKVHAHMDVQRVLCTVCTDSRTCRGAPVRPILLDLAKAWKGATGGQMSTKVTKSCAGPNIRKEYHFDVKMDPIYVKLHFYFFTYIGPSRRCPALFFKGSFSV